MILIRKLHVGFQFLLCVIDIYSKYAWLLPLKDRKGIIITKAFQENQGRLSKKNDRTYIQYIMKESLLLLKDLLEP